VSKQLIDAFSRLLDDLDRREADRNNRATTHLAEVRGVVQGLCKHEWPENWRSTNYAFCKHCGKTKEARRLVAAAGAAKTGGDR
jgi:hypothetical protein